MIARLISVPSRHLKAGRKFVVNHPLTILRGTVAALFSHSYGSPLGIAAVLPDDRDSRGSGCHFQHQHLCGLMLSARIGRADGVFLWVVPYRVPIPAPFGWRI